MSNGVSPYTLTPPLPVLFPSQLEAQWLHQRPGQTGRQRCRGQRRQHRILERSRVPPDACAPSSCDGETGRGGVGLGVGLGVRATGMRQRAEGKADRQNQAEGTGGGGADRNKRSDRGFASFVLGVVIRGKVTVGGLHTQGKVLSLLENVALFSPETSLFS